MFLIGGQDNKWLRELMQRSVKPGNKLLVLKTNPRNIKAAGLRSAALSFKFPAVTNFLQSAIGRTHIESPAIADNS